MMKRLIAGLTAGMLMFGGVALAENEATFDFNTGVLNIPEVAVGPAYYNVTMQQQGQGLDFTVTGATRLPLTPSSLLNAAAYYPETGALNIPAVIVGADRYSVNMAQGNGLTFSVTGAEAVDVSLVDPVGVWDEADFYPFVYVFNADGTWTGQGPGNTEGPDSEYGTYTVSGSSLHLTGFQAEYSGAPTPLTPIEATISGNSMVITDSDYGVRFPLVKR